MKYCERCGELLDDTAIFCPRCGSEVRGVRSNYSTEQVWQSADNNSYRWITALSFLFIPLALIFYMMWKYDNPAKSRAAIKGGFYGVSFSYPLVGLILYLVLKDSRSSLARGCGKSAIIGFVLKTVLVLLMAVLYFEANVSFGVYDELFSLMLVSLR